MAPKRWGINLPFRDYRFEYEDWVPAMAATIGKIVMVAAIVAALVRPNEKGEPWLPFFVFGLLAQR